MTTPSFTSSYNNTGDDENICGKTDNEVTHAEECQSEEIFAGAGLSVLDMQIADEQISIAEGDQSLELSHLRADIINKMLTLHGWQTQVIKDPIGPRQKPLEFVVGTRELDRPATPLKAFRESEIYAGGGGAEATSATVENDLEKSRAKTQMTSGSKSEHPRDVKNTSSTHRKKPAVISRYGSQGYDSDAFPPSLVDFSVDSSLPAVARSASASTPPDFRSLSSVQAMSLSSSTLCLGFDTEFVERVDSFGRGAVREVLSYQFSLVDPSNPERMKQMILFPSRVGDRLSVETALSLVIGLLDISDSESWKNVDRDGVLASDCLVWRSHNRTGGYELFETAADAAAHAYTSAERDALLASVRGLFPSNYRRRTGSDDENARGVGVGAEFSMQRLFKKRGVGITLVSHFGQADLTTFRPTEDLDLVTRVVKAGGGLVSDRDIRVCVPRLGDLKRKRLYPVRLAVRDSISHAPAGMASLKALGAACGVEKLSVGDSIVEMDRLLERDLWAYTDYAMNDAVIVVEYMTRSWGLHKGIPMTLSSAAAKAIKAAGIAYFGVPGSRGFDELFSGSRPVDLGLDVVEGADNMVYHDVKGLEHVNSAARDFQYMSAAAFKGGCNLSATVGWFGTTTYDHDLENAYPTAMSLVFDVDWLRDGGCIAETIAGRELTLDDFPHGVLTPLVGEVSFEFPADEKFPCIPITLDSSVVYPLSSAGVQSVPAMAPELYLALLRGATIKAHRVYVAHIKYRENADGAVVPSRSLGNGVRSLVRDRSLAKSMFGAKSLEELVLKTAVNSCYGKTAQQVVDHKTWSAFKQEMDNTGGSSITSPYHASFTTSLVRAAVLAKAGDLTDNGYTVHSITTDGLITDAGIDVVAQHDALGFSAVLEEGRIFLTGDPTIWAVKHEQPEFLNGSTRLNIARVAGGVLAHGSFKTPRDITRDSIEDRAWMWDLYVNRVGGISNPYRALTTFKELSSLTDRKDFLGRTMNRSLKMDFDLKRMPLVDQMISTEVEDTTGVKHEVARLMTKPWPSVTEALKARQVRENLTCLRTTQDWRTYQTKFAALGTNLRIVDGDRAILRSLIIWHRRRRGINGIPTLADPTMKLADKLEWLASFGLGEPSKSDWDNACRPDRQSRYLPTEILMPYLLDMGVAPDHLVEGSAGQPIDD